MNVTPNHRLDRMATKRRTVLISVAVLLFLLAAFCLFGAVSFAWQATSGAAAYGAQYVATHNTIARCYLIAACIAILGSGTAVVLIVRTGRASPTNLTHQ